MGTFRTIVYGKGVDAITTRTERAPGDEKPFAAVKGGKIIRTCDTWDSANGTCRRNNGAVILRLALGES